MSDDERTQRLPTATHKVFFFTANNPTDEWEQRVALSQNSSLYHLRGQLETAPTTGTRHIQGWIFFHNKRSWDATRTLISGIFGTLPHLEVCRTDEGAHYGFHYVHKSASSVAGTQFSVGIDVPQKYLVPYTGILGQGPRPKRVLIFYGVPRSGKSKSAKRICEIISPKGAFEVGIETQGQRTRWIGDYNGERAVFIDEFNPTKFSKDQLKCLFDTEPHSIATSMGGGSSIWEPELVILCQNCPEKYYLKYPATEKEMQEWDRPLKWVQDEVFMTRISGVFHFFDTLPSEFLPNRCISFK